MTKKPGSNSIIWMSLDLEVNLWNQELVSGDNCYLLRKEGHLLQVCQDHTETCSSPTAPYKNHQGEKKNKEIQI